MKDTPVFLRSLQSTDHIIMSAVEQLSSNYLALSTKAKNFSEIYLEPISLVVDIFGCRYLDVLPSCNSENISRFFF